MFCLRLLLVILSVCTVALGLPNCNQTTKLVTAEEAIARFFDYFNQEDPVGIPVLDFEEPADLFSPLETYPITLTNGTVYGHSETKIEEGYLNFVTLKGKIAVSAPYLEINGNYSWPSIFSTSEGLSNTSMINSNITTNFSMIINREEVLQIEEVDIEIEYDEIYIDMTDLQWEQQLLIESGVVHTYFNEIFKQIFKQFQPYVLGEVNRELNCFISKLPSIGQNGGIMDTTVDFSTPEYQKKALSIFLNRIMNFLKLDPIQLPSKSFRLLGVKILFSEGILHGASHIKDIERLFVIYKDKQFYIESLMVYRQFQLLYVLGIHAGVLSNFDIPERVRLNDVKVHIKLTVDPSGKTPPKLIHLGLDVGSFGKIRTGKRRNFMSRMFKNVFDDSRNRIVKALSGPIKKIVQNDLNQLDLKEEALNFLKSQE